jgi:hypothetical protein
MAGHCPIVKYYNRNHRGLAITKIPTLPEEIPVRTPISKI